MGSCPGVHYDVLQSQTDGNVGIWGLFEVGSTGRRAHGRTHLREQESNL